MKKLLLIVFALSNMVLAGPKPMESIIKYNVVMIHGATDEGSGIEKVKGDNSPCINDVDYPEATVLQQQHIDKVNAGIRDTVWNLGDAANMIGSYDRKDHINNWLNTNVFEYTADSLRSPYIYMQRSFVNPAESPAINAREVGDRSWIGSNQCKNRRSLFEEAQEVRAGGQQALSRDRKSMKYRSLPSRYITIAHSMGGVTSREYVESPTFYNDDVDKVITLDSPHEGTGALNLLLALQNPARHLLMGVPEMILTAIGFTTFSSDPASSWMSTILWTIAIANGTQDIVTEIAELVKLEKDFPYKPSDGNPSRT